MPHLLSFPLLDAALASHPFLLSCILVLAWGGISWWTWRSFSATERSFFSMADEECRSFVSESYSNSSADLGTFKFPSSYGANRLLAFLTFWVGAGTLLAFTLFPDLDFVEALSIFLALFFAQRLTWFDGKHLFLPDGDVAAFGFFSLVLAVSFHRPEDWPYVALSALALASFLWILTTAFRVLRGKEGLGMGDVKLLFAMLPLLSFATLTHVLLLDSVFGMVWWVVQKIRKKETASQFPFGPFLLLGWAIALVNMRHAFLPW